MIYSRPITEVIPNRFSCRAYLEAPIAPEKQRMLRDFMKTLTVGPFGTPVRFDLIAADDQDRKALRGLGTYGFIKGASAFEIPYPIASFDLVINGYMFDLMPVDAMAGILAEFRRVLKPGGRLVLMNMTEGERPGSQVYQWLYQRSPALMGGCRGVKLAGLLPQAGFQVVTREYHQQCLFPSEVILAKST